MSEYGQQGQTRENNSEQWECQSVSRRVVSVALVDGPHGLTLSEATK
jgi:hypothetical protein